MTARRMIDWIREKLGRRPTNTITVSSSSTLAPGDFVTIYMHDGRVITQRVRSVDSGATLTIEPVGLLARFRAWVRRCLRGRS